ncbi:FHA domain-containing protein [Streptomyces cavernae]|uniref:FHA domain-containing protein n=1 Tax=Streptomyces cavernae TaxID=2259034 RepID=UPI000FEB7D3C|nr:FHA domain-containing protein [Streptomyces cavernae]
MPTCPNGHQSGSDDWCEVCGHRMAGAVPPPPPPGAGYGYPPPGPGGHSPMSGMPGAERCPQCGTPREGGAPFCEECRWNFLTNTATSYSPAGQRPPGPGGQNPAHRFQQQPGPSYGGGDGYDYQGSRPSQVNRPAEPIPGHYGDPSGYGDPSRPMQQPHQPQPTAPGQGFGEDDWMIPPPSAGGPGGGYGYPQQGSGQAPPGYPQQQQSLTWTATIGPDRDYFMAMMQRSGPEATGLNLPAYSPEQQRPLVGNQITIGRRRHSTGESPDIDLSVPPEDPGVSHQHAVLVQQPDGSWAVVDQNSTNGTTVNGGEEPIQPFVPVPLQDGDRVHVGAWTTITIRRG